MEASPFSRSLGLNSCKRSRPRAGRAFGRCQAPPVGGNRHGGPHCHRSL